MVAKLIIHPTAAAQWSELVNEASATNNIKLSENLASYLVFLLTRFTKSPEIANQIMALALLDGLHQPPIQRQQALRDVGDVCLLYSGFFPAMAQRRLVRVSYFVKIGQTAYFSLSEYSGASSLSNLFLELGEQFIVLMEVLQVMRELDGDRLSLDPILAEEIWSDTGSKHALDILQRFTNVRPIAPSSGSFMKH